MLYGQPLFLSRSESFQKVLFAVTSSYVFNTNIEVPLNQVEVNREVST